MPADEKDGGDQGQANALQRTAKTDNPSAASPTGAKPPLALVIDSIADRVDPILKLIQQILSATLQTRESQARHALRMTCVAASLVVLVVVVAALLTYAGKIDGSTFTFLLGLVVGYVLTFVRDSIAPPRTD